MRLFAVFCIIIGMIACNSNIDGGNTSLNPSDSAQTNNPQDIEKLYELGFKYYIGDSVERDTIKAIDLIQKAAELGHIGGETLLAYCYFRGDGIDKNYDECVKWCRRAAEKGDGEAQILLGECYLNGYGCKVDTLSAIEWYGKAAEKGWDEALCALNDIGVKPYIKATKKFVKNNKYYLKWDK